MVNTYITPADINELIEQCPYDIKDGKMSVNDVKLLLMDFYTKLDNEEF